MDLDKNKIFIELKRQILLVYLSFVVLFISSFLFQNERLYASTEIDFTSFLKMSTLPGKTLCQDNHTSQIFNSNGVEIKLLGVAVVYMGPGLRLSSFGHLANRLIFCIGENFYDIFYDHIMQDGHFNDESRDDSLKTYKQHFMRKITNPTSTGLYQREQFNNNRNIYELWLNINQKEAYKMLMSLEDRYSEQLRRLKQKENLPLFKKLDRNCTSEISKNLASWKKVKSISKIVRVSNMSANRKYRRTKNKKIKLSNTFLKTSFPKVIYNLLLKNNLVKKTILYPSQRLFSLMKDSNPDSLNNIKENFTFSSKATGKIYTKQWMLMYPEGDKSYNNFITKPASGLVNLVTSSIQLSWGFLKLPVSAIIDTRNSLQDIKNGAIGMLYSLLEIPGLRFRYPPHRAFNKNEMDFMKEVLEKEKPSIFKFFPAVD